jgi:hypothetical protein
MEAKKGRREMKKFELTTESITNALGKKLFRIKALVEFGDVKAGELGGYVEKEGNVSQDGNAWVYEDAAVYGDAKVYEDAQVYGYAQVYGDARVYGYAQVYGDARVYGDAAFSGDARVSGNADYACIKGFGTEFRHTTFYKTKENGIGVKCGCFNGSLEQFREQVKETRTGKIVKEYLAIADLMEYHFARGDSDDE